ncbi:MAG: D-alanyl-D-alanine carboxypeptidase/D-alanyl-D-alanine-endopeptidase [Acidobacteria bacterium]|jgi:D-alanyl-D-alanine carboxypeptidase/D-alanyl-D-alanine-endopeptidase (penicillin-binding protein 4)|nr:MAG: D-alanyl-D-alanine carboxypeptidase/D-alanyl-D-alanine-endopeptidase [Acidobacteriota bacterium]GIU82380.1 MAG: peptidase M15 [Pyrinomonadaceae bacterium]
MTRKIKRVGLRIGKIQKGFSDNHSFLMGIIVFLLFYSVACFKQEPVTNQNEGSEEMQFSELQTSVESDAPLQVSQKPEDVVLASKIDKLIETSRFANARWGIFVVSLKDGRILTARDARKPFIPASVLKILTSAVALDKLGADFRWQTKLFTNGKIEDSVVKGDLILYGQGAPDFDESGVEELVQKLKAKGVKKITGDIIGDESYFRGDKLGDGWVWNEIQWYYGAEASALTINANQVGIHLQGSKVTSTSEFVEIKAEVQRSSSNEIDSIGVKRELGENSIYVWGAGGNLDVRLAVQNPALWAAKILDKKLRQSGIEVQGKVKSVDWKSKEKLDPENATEIASIQSRPLGEIVHKMNKYSVNLYAELILRTLGKKFGSETLERNPKMRKVRGDDRAGAAVIEKWLEEKGIKLQENESIKDGSGLSRLNLVTPETIARVLIAATKIKNSDVFAKSLPIAGIDGTLSARLTNFAGKINAKTGSISFVNSLAGYIRKRDETIVFVIFCNNASAESVTLIDKIVSELASH